ncbi:hypothetical protein CAP2UW1_4503 (plasmid) [Candidatus Accumulibacter phosphatis clade IIA str. UW-1]|uniref:Uncharacterized protein n=1 Tax=Accumulibacter regalis TaxID=522306 RepID=C7RWA9_ACCRE
MARLWRAVHGLTFPINAGALAQEWSRNVVPEAPIGELQAKEGSSQKTENKAR